MSEGRRCGATGPAKRLRGKVGITDLRQHHRHPRGPRDSAAHSQAPSQE